MLVVDLLPPHRHDVVVVTDAALVQSRARRGRAACEHRSEPRRSAALGRQPAGRCPLGDAHPPVGHRRASLRRGARAWDSYDDAGDSPSAADGLALTLVVLASIVAFVAMFSVWVNRQVLNTDNWTATSSRLLEQPVIRDQVAGFLVDELYANVDVEGEIRAALPPRAQPLAGPAAGALRNFAERAAQRGAGAPARAARLGGAPTATPTSCCSRCSRAAARSSRRRAASWCSTSSRCSRRRRRGSASADASSSALPADAAEITILHSDQLERRAGRLQDPAPAADRARLAVAAAVRDRADHLARLAPQGGAGLRHRLHRGRRARARRDLDPRRHGGRLARPHRGLRARDRGDLDGRRRRCCTRSPCPRSATAS